jgi:hypothetical protein
VNTLQHREEEEEEEEVVKHEKCNDSDLDH